MAKKEKSNDALDILIMAVEKMKDEIMDKLYEYDVEDDLLFDIMEIFNKYFHLE